jgi:hypothetical protein
MAHSLRPTLHDVARTAGVSHMTVSRVVRESRAVSPATALKVRAAIARLGYRPDPALSALAAYRTRRGGARGSVLAFLDCDGTPYSQVVLAGARREAELLGYRLERFRLPATLRGQARLNDILFHRGIRGLLFGPSDYPGRFEGWDWSRFAPVSLGALTHQPAMHSVALDYFHGALTACQRLEAWGCRRIALVVREPLEARTGHRWIGGYHAWLAFAAQKRPLVLTRWSASGIRSWLRRERVDGLLTIHRELDQAAAPGKLRLIFLNDAGSACGCPYLALDPRRIGGEGVAVLHHLLLRAQYGLPALPKTVALRAALTAGGELAGLRNVRPEIG